MPPTLPGEDEGGFSSCAGRKGQVDRPTSPPKEGKNKEKLVRIGSRFFSKDTSTTKRFNIGVEVGKSPSGVRVKSLNEFVSEKERTYKPVNKRLHACPGSEAVRPSEDLSPVRE